MSGNANFQYNAPTDFRIAQTTPDEVPQEYKAAFSQIYGAIQQVIFTLVNNAGIGPRNAGQWADLAGSAVTLLAGNLNRFYVQGAESISAGAAVSFVNVAGTLQAVNAVATSSTTPAIAFCTAPDGIDIGIFGEVQIVAGTVAIGGLTPGASYYLSNTPGLISPTPGTLAQYLGFAISSSVLAFNIDAPALPAVAPENEVTALASENIAFGAAVSFHDVAGTINVRNANATNNTRPAQGFCSEPAGITTGNSGAAIVGVGAIPIGGLTIGDSYYLSTTDGLIAPTPAVAAGNIEQFLGFAVATTSLYFNISSWRQH